MKHALVVGGTGMLSNVSLWLVENGYHVSVIARNPERMEKLKNKASYKGNLTPLLVNYTIEEKLQEKVKYTIAYNGCIDIVVSWIHSVAGNALTIIADEITKSGNEWDLFQILGSSSDLDRIKQKTPVPASCFYYQVQLGFMSEEGHSRWLTNNEISEGVIEAIKKKKKVLTVGQLEPWEDRP